jgi:hypothetical protein
VSISISALHFTAVLSNLTNSNNMQQLTADPEVFQMSNKAFFSQPCYSTSNSNSNTETAKMTTATENKMN